MRVSDEFINTPGKREDSALDLQSHELGRKFCSAEPQSGAESIQGAVSGGNGGQDGRFVRRGDRCSCKEGKCALSRAVPAHVCNDIGCTGAEDSSIANETMTATRSNTADLPRDGKDAFAVFSGKPGGVQSAAALTGFYDEGGRAPGGDDAVALRP